MSIIVTLLSRFRPPVKQPQGLISVLLDRRAEFCDRDDAAMDLSAFDDQAAFDALLSVATDTTEGEDLHDHCGESLAYIDLWRRHIDAASLPQIRPAAQAIFVAMVEANDSSHNA